MNGISGALPMIDPGAEHRDAAETHAYRVLVAAPTAGDATALVAMLMAHRIDAVAANSLEQLMRTAKEGVGLFLLAQEALTGTGVVELRRFLSNQPAWSDLPLLVLTLGGEKATTSLRSLALFGPSGNVTLLERPFRQITLLSAVQVALRARRKQYEVRDLLERLDHQTRDLARSNADLEQFAYVTSHDLQEPLRMISSYLQLIERDIGGSLNPRARQHFAYAIDGSVRMRGIINAMLQYARIGGSDDVRGDVDAAALVREVAGDLREDLLQAGVTIDIKPLPHVVANPALLARVFQNLIANAIKFRHGHAPSITISAEESADEWMFTVEDNGIGIPAEQKDRLFKLFQRLNARGAYAGEGIGLATCRRIVERHGGRIWVDSVVGEGSSFRFTLPMHQGQVRVQELDPQSGPVEILIVDDNPGDIDLLAEVFETDDYAEITVSGVTSGALLIDRLNHTDRSRLPALILVDLNMPGMDGKSVLAFLKSHPLYRSIPTLMYTSSMRQSERQECLQLGADDYVVKPSSMDEYEDVAKRIVGFLEQGSADLRAG